MAVITDSSTENLSKQPDLPDALYRVTQENLYHPDLGEYSTYGIQVIAFNDIDILHDVSVCKKTADHIVELINHFQLSPIHLRDIVTDLLP